MHPGTSWFETYLAGKPIDLGGRAGLLLDGALVEDRWNLTRVMNAPLKHPRNPVMIEDRPWEVGGVKRPDVLWDAEAGLFRMWYTVAPMSLETETMLRRAGMWTEEIGQSRVVAYAESRDGVNWEKPAVRRYAGHQGTNIVMDGEHRAAASVRVTYNHPSTGQPGKFLMSYADWHPGLGRSLYLAYSDDGTHWRRDPGNPVYSPVIDTTHNLCYDEENGRWFMYTRPLVKAGHLEHRQSLLGVKTNISRRAAVAVGDTPHSLGPIRGLKWPDEAEASDYDDFLVTRVGSHYLSCISGMYDRPYFYSDVFLGFSFDGLHWDRLPENPPLIPRGPEGAFDAGQAQTVKSIVQRGDLHYLYYAGTPYAQKVSGNETHIGLARLPRHRFIAQMAPAEGGYLLTRQVRVSHPRLLVNMTLEATSGTAAAFAAEVLVFESNGTAKAVEGYTFADCTTRASDALDVPVTWRDHKDLSRLVGEAVMIRFYLKEAGLYAFQFVD